MGRQFLPPPGTTGTNATNGVNGKKQLKPQQQPVVVDVMKKKKVKKKKKKGSKRRKVDAETKENSQEEDSVFQRRLKDGSTSLAILTPGEGIVPGTTRDRPISLGSLIGRIKNGSSSLQGFREDKRNIVKPMYALSYGMFASHGPAYDSTFANLTVEESKIVEACDKFLEQGEHKDAIRSVCLGDYTNTFVDHIIDIFEVKEDLVEEDTEVVVMEDVKPCSSDVTVVPMTSESSSSSEDVAVASMSENSTAGDIDFDALKSLSDEGIDMSFLGSLQARLVATQPTTSSSSSSASSTADQPSVLSVESRLEATAGLLESLKTVQQERLSLPPPANLNLIVPPSDKELELAEQVLDNLTSIIQTAARPDQVASLPAIRRAMGVSLIGGNGPTAISAAATGNGATTTTTSETTADDASEIMEI